MKCKKCGHKNKKNAQYCLICGEPLEHGNNHFKIIIALVIIILILLCAIGYQASNINLENNNTNVNDVNNTTTDDNLSDEELNEDNDVNTIQSTPSTLNQINSEVIQIYGVSFTVPVGGNYRTACTYQFKFNGLDCEVEEVEQYETSDSQRTIEPYEFSKYYPGGESYKLIVNNHVWKGIKIEKNNRWYHISMKTDDDEDVLQMLDWMYEKNSWVNH